jgi:hypothetical protein
MVPAAPPGNNGVIATVRDADGWVAGGALGAGTGIAAGAVAEVAAGAVAGTAVGADLEVGVAFVAAAAAPPPMPATLSAGPHPASAIKDAAVTSRSIVKGRIPTFVLITSLVCRVSRRPRRRAQRPNVLRPFPVSRTPAITAPAGASAWSAPPPPPGYLEEPAMSPPPPAFGPRPNASPASPCHPCQVISRDCPVLDPLLDSGRSLGIARVEEALDSGDQDAPCAAVHGADASTCIATEHPPQRPRRVRARGWARVRRRRPRRSMRRRWSYR